MSGETKKATLYLDPKIHRALRIKAVETSQSMSRIVNDAVAASLAEDAADLAAFEERAGDPLVTYEQALEELKRDGKI